MAGMYSRQRQLSSRPRLAQSLGQRPTMAQLRQQGLTNDPGFSTFQRQPANQAIAHPSDRRFNLGSAGQQSQMLNAVGGAENPLQANLAERRAANNFRTRSLAQGIAPQQPSLDTRIQRWANDYIANLPNNQGTTPVSVPARQPVGQMAPAPATEINQAAQQSVINNAPRTPPGYMLAADATPEYAANARQAVSDLEQARQGNFPQLDQAREMIQSPGAALQPVTPPAGSNPNRSRYTYNMQGQGDALAARFGNVQGMVDRYSGGLQAPLTASQRRLLAGANQEGQQAPLAERAFQPQRAGTPSNYTDDRVLPGGSTVTVDENGRAIVQGNMSDRRLNQLGVQRLPSDNGYRRDTSLQAARNAANTRRMQNERLADRLGIENPLPSAPIAPPTGEITDPDQYRADLQASLSTQRDLARQLGRTPSARVPGRNTPLADSLGQNPPEQTNELTDEQRYVNTRAAVASELRGSLESGVFGTGPEAMRAYNDAVDQETAARMPGYTPPGGEAVTSTGDSQTVPASAAVEGMTDPVLAEEQLSNQGYSTEEADAELERMLSRMTPAQRREAEARIAQARSSRFWSEPSQQTYRTNRQVEYGTLPGMQ